MSKNVVDYCRGWMIAGWMSAHHEGGRMSSQFHKAFGWGAFLFLLLWPTFAKASDLLVGSDNFGGSLNGILRYDGNTGAFVGRFINIDRPFSMAYGPDGNL